MILVFVVNSLSRPRAPRSRRPEPNGLLGLPTQNQTLWCERVLRQETSIVPIFEIGATELLVRYPSSSAQLPLQSCVDSPEGFADSWRDCASFAELVFVPKLRSSTEVPHSLGSGTTVRLKD